MNRIRLILKYKLTTLINTKPHHHLKYTAHTHTNIFPTRKSGKIENNKKKTLSESDVKQKAVVEINSSS